MKQETNKKKTIITVVLIILMIIVTTVGAKALWDALTQSKDINVPLGDNVELTLGDFQVDSNKSLIPSTAVMGSNDTHKLTFTANITIKNNKQASNLVLAATHNNSDTDILISINISDIINNVATIVITVELDSNTNFDSNKHNQIKTINVIVVLSQNN